MQWPATFGNTIGGPSFFLHHEIGCERAQPTAAFFKKMSPRNGARETLVEIVHGSSYSRVINASVFKTVRAAATKAAFCAMSPCFKSGDGALSMNFCAA